MSKTFSKGISTPIGLAVIFFAIGLAGWAVLWQYSEMEKEALKPYKLITFTKFKAVDPKTEEDEVDIPLPVEPEIYIHSISTDKNIYHSSEIMDLDMVIYSNVDAADIAVKVAGIKNRFNEEKVLDMAEGMNNVSFSYQLPKCNVCGGISTGDYSLNCEVNYNGITVNDSIIINIRQ